MQFICLFLVISCIVLSYFIAGVRRATENLYLPAGPLQRRIINKDLAIYTAKPIGGGAFGTVFPGSFRRNPCAVKVLNPHATQLLSSLPASQTVQTEALQRFRNECETLKSFKHPNLVRYITSCNDPKSNLPLLVMELMDESLTQFLKGRESTDKHPHLLSIHTQISLSHNIASALAYIHAKNLVHRDLCSDNVLLRMTSSSTTLAKISDFGMSKLIDPEDLNQSLTTLGHREAYLPPEARKITSNEYDSSLDIFSFGVVMVQIVENISRITCSADRDLYIQEIKNAELPSPLYQLIVCCVQVDKAGRQNAVQIIVNLETLSL